MIFFVNSRTSSILSLSKHKRQQTVPKFHYCIFTPAAIDYIGGIRQFVFALPSIRITKLSKILFRITFVTTKNVLCIEETTRTNLTGKKSCVNGFSEKLINDNWFQPNIQLTPTSYYLKNKTTVSDDFKTKATVKHNSPEKSDTIWMWERRNKLKHIMSTIIS